MDNSKIKPTARFPNLSKQKKSLEKEKFSKLKSLEEKVNFISKKLGLV